jgi:F-type H+-transporting ATPase subunit b
LIFLPKSTNLSTMEQNPILDLFSLTNEDAQMIVVGTIFLFGLYFALRSSLFKPLLAHLEEREAVTAGAVHTASQMRQKAQALRARYDEGMLQARIAANKERQTAIAKAKATAGSLVAEAEAKAAKELQSGRQSIEAALQQAHAKAEGEAQALADTLTTKVDSQLTVH